MKNKALLMACCLLAACSSSKKLTSASEERKETTSFRALDMQSCLDSLFRTHLKVSITYTEDNFLPVVPTGTSVVPAPTSPVPSPVTPSSTPVSRKQVTINLESASETRVQKKDSLADRSGISTNEEKKSLITKEKEKSLSWTFSLWILLVLVLVAAALYCVKKKINPIVELLKLLRTWL